MKREVIEAKALGKVIDGMVQELSSIYHLPPEMLINIVKSYAEYMTDYLRHVVVVNLN